MTRHICSLAALMLFATPALAQEEAAGLEDVVNARAAQIVSVLNGEMEADQVFAPDFLSAVPPAQLKQITDSLVEQNGAIQTIDELEYRGNGAAAFEIVFEKARGDALLQLVREEPYLVSGFRITGVRPIGDNPAQILSEIVELPGTASLGLYRLEEDGPQSVLTQNAYEQLALGSTFKLYVLSALVQEIAAGERSWNDVVQLDARSLPSGQMQDWPTGSPVTLHTLALMMISISDNTATDALISIVGREMVEAEMMASGHSAPELNVPMMTTGEMFAIKLGDSETRQAYLAADSEARAKILEGLNIAGLDASRIGSAFGGKPVAIGIEWFASGEDIARIFKRIVDSGDQTALDILAINPSVPTDQRGDWSYIGYKGGSEPGVLNLSWLLQDRQGRWIVLTLGWNNPDDKLEDSKLSLIGHRLIGLIASADR
jgi:hypothetical protein